MIPGSGRSEHPLAYPLTVTFGALAVITAWAPFADVDQLSALAAVAVGVVGYSGVRVARALGWLGSGIGARERLAVKRVRQQHRLVSRSWLEFTQGRRTRWLPVYFDPTLITLTESTAELGERSIRVNEVRLFPSGRVRDTEPPGRLIDNPSRPAPDSDTQARAASSPLRRLLLDAQSVVAAPFAGLFWIYIDGGGIPAFTAATCVAAVTATWLSAIRGSDPS
ncbi:hypothetical protein [Nocardia cyriacigeorgica]|uniref:hypothetical protein n=1 Tax=Nocardia cyriacigeorgica TaxID=135487 RepID=UPI002805AB32|nr:hypothetical protein [Nocardia cyriacigeorgica]